jgi:hypothetical protein
MPLLFFQLVDQSKAMFKEIDPANGTAIQSSAY